MEFTITMTIIIFLTSGTPTMGQTTPTTPAATPATTTTTMTTTTMTPTTTTTTIFAQLSPAEEVCYRNLKDCMYLKFTFFNVDVAVYCKRAFSYCLEKAAIDALPRQAIKALQVTNSKERAIAFSATIRERDCGEQTYRCITDLTEHTVKMCSDYLRVCIKEAIKNDRIDYQKKLEKEEEERKKLEDLEKITTANRANQLSVPNFIHIVFPIILLLVV